MYTGYDKKVPEYTEYLLKCNQALHGYQFRRFHNLILGIHEGDIPAYNTSGRGLLEERKLKYIKGKEDARETAKLAGD